MTLLRLRPTGDGGRVHVVVLVLAGLALVLLGAAAALALSARSAYADLTASRDDLLKARDAISATDLPAAQAALTTAAESASSAADTVDGPLWNAAAAIPGLGATPAAVQAVTTSLDTALTALGPATDALGTLDPDTLVSDDGSIDLATLEDALPTLQTAQDGIAEARTTLAAAPTKQAGDLVLTQVDNAATELDTQLTELDGTLDGAITAGSIAVPLLGADGPKRYFVAILNPNEARGTGGFLGQYAILRTERGRITVEEVGSNNDLPTLTALPDNDEDLGEQYVARYGDDPTLIANMNLSPHYPAAARNWLASWEQRTGEQLDGAFSADVVALGELVTATGEEVPLPDGGSLSGEELTQFAIQGVYEKFPEAAEVPARKAYQEAVTAEAIHLITQSPQRTALASALGTALTDRRIQLWSAEADTQQAILDADLGGTLRVGPGHNLTFVAINVSGSKLDAFLERSVAYEVGRCPGPESGRVESQVTVEMTNAIPQGAAVPEYMISLAERGPAGPVNLTIAQVHLPVDAEILEVIVDGKSAQYSEFVEQDRNTALLQLRLPPREARTLQVHFSEPASETPGLIAEQPLGSLQESTVRDLPCSPTG